MESFTNFEAIGLITVLAVVSFFALRQLTSRITDDVYDGTKAGLRALFARKDDAKPTAPRTPAGPPEVATPIGRIHGLTWLADGDVARLFTAKLQSGTGGAEYPVVLKLPMSQADSDLLREEDATLKALAVEAQQYAKHLPQVLTRFRLADQRLALVLDHLEGFTLTQLRARFTDGIEPRHITWILRRCLSVLGYVHSRQVLHGNITPDHILVRPQDHNVWLLDWTRAVTSPRVSGQHFRVVHPVYGPPEAHRQQPALPSSDLYSLALCIGYGLGGEAGAREDLGKAPEPLARLLRFMLKESPLQRPQDAWELYTELEKIRDAMFGPHRFVEFVVD